MFRKMFRNRKRQDLPRRINFALARMCLTVDRAKPADADQFYDDFYWVKRVAETNAQRHRADHLEREFAHAIYISPVRTDTPF